MTVIQFKTPGGGGKSSISVLKTARGVDLQFTRSLGEIVHSETVVRLGNKQALEMADAIVALTGPALAEVAMSPPVAPVIDAVAFSADVTDERVLRVHFASRVNDGDRARLLAAINTAGTPYIADLEAAVLDAEHALADISAAVRKGWSPRTVVFAMADAIRARRRAVTP